MPADDTKTVRSCGYITCPLPAMVPAEHRASAREDRPLAALLQELGECMAAASDDASTNTPHTESEAIGVRLCSVLVALLNKCISADRGALSTFLLKARAQHRRQEPFYRD